MLYDLIAGRQPDTPAMALRLARPFGNAPASWLNPSGTTTCGCRNIGWPTS